MNSMQIRGLDTPQELSGVLVCDALMLRDGIVISTPKRTASVEAESDHTASVGK